MPETAQARYQAHQSGQNSCSYETIAALTETDIYSYISAIYVISCVIPTFVGLDICTLNHRDLFVINLNGRYPEISVTDLRDIWN